MLDLVAWRAEGETEGVKKAPLYGELANEVRLSGCERHKRNFTACVSMLYPIYFSISFSVPITPFMCVRS